jgi:hypothetical protein
MAAAGAQFGDLLESLEAASCEMACFRRATLIFLKDRFILLGEGPEWHSGAVRVLNAIFGESESGFDALVYSASPLASSSSVGSRRMLALLRESLGSKLGAAVVNEQSAALYPRWGWRGMPKGSPLSLRWEFRGLPLSSESLATPLRQISERALGERCKIFDRSLEGEWQTSGLSENGFCSLQVRATAAGISGVWDLCLADEKNVQSLFVEWQAFQRSGNFLASAGQSRWSGVYAMNGTMPPAIISGLWIPAPLGVGLSSFTLSEHRQFPSRNEHNETAL